MELYLKAVWLGIVEGLTEFLPVSSTGHLILAEEFVNTNISESFSTMIQLGAILAICVLYFQKLWGVFIALPHSRAARQFAAGILIAFLPAMVIGFLFHDFIKGELFNPIVVSFSLLIGGVAILIAEQLRPAPSMQTVDDIDLKTALKIGFIQCLAMIPGVSRSGATILGGMMLGVERKAAAEFSFFRAIPTMLGVFDYDAYKNHEALLAQGGHELMLIGVGFVVSFITAIIVVRSFLSIVTKYGFAPFAYYRIILGGVMLMYLIFIA